MRSQSSPILLLFIHIWNNRPGRPAASSPGQRPGYYGRVLLTPYKLLCLQREKLPLSAGGKNDQPRATPWVCWGGNFFNTETQRTQRMYSQSQRLQERPKGLAQRLRPSKHSGSSLWRPLGRSVTLGVLYLCDSLSVLCVSVLKKWWEYRVTQKCGLNAYTYHWILCSCPKLSPVVFYILTTT